MSPQDTISPDRFASITSRLDALSDLPKERRIYKPGRHCYSAVLNRAYEYVYSEETWLILVGEELIERLEREYVAPAPTAPMPEQHTAPTPAQHAAPTPAPHDAELDMLIEELADEFAWGELDAHIAEHVVEMWEAERDEAGAEYHTRRQAEAHERLLDESNARQPDTQTWDAIAQACSVLGVSAEGPTARACTVASAMIERGDFASARLIVAVGLLSAPRTQDVPRSLWPALAARLIDLGRAAGNDRVHRLVREARDAEAQLAQLPPTSPERSGLEQIARFARAAVVALMFPR